MGNKLGKLLKIDAVMNTAIRGRFAWLCVQLDTIKPLPKRPKIDTFWQDIVYENVLVLCFRCGRIGHKEPLFLESIILRSDTLTSILNPHGEETRNAGSEPSHSAWKIFQTRRQRTRGVGRENANRILANC